MSKRGVLHASVALVALSAVLCFVAVSLMGSSSNTETVLAFKHPNKRAEWAKCAKIAKIFKGTKPDHRQITESEKREAKQCVHLIKMAKAIKAKDMKLNQAEQSCTCCSFPGCPCCQEAWSQGTNGISTPAMHHSDVTKLVHMPKKPHFKKFRSKFAKKKTMHKAAQPITEPDAY